ncbi:RhoGEF domain-containing protein [Planoprotostelium fungivorum]|uniref:RhoGEF domain-containing protein n=1 Tax=Planoprotostelium fungivorum TaxID=1890364 RepID=A0A2P6NUQ9_9EUKA|nr:RhoGEF domain-containing protein [Planoprotostelium fungivorum]
MEVPADELPDGQGGLDADLGHIRGSSVFGVIDLSSEDEVPPTPTAARRFTLEHEFNIVTIVKIQARLRGFARRARIRSRRRLFLASQILARQKEFVQQMQFLKEHYIHGIDGKLQLNPVDISTMFSKIPEILDNAREFYQKLKDRMIPWTNRTHISDIILEREHPEFEALLNRLEHSQRSDRHLSRLLIVPTLHASLFHADVSDLLNETPIYLPEREGLKKAVDALREVSIAVNEKQNTVERQSSELSDVIVGYNVSTPGRYFIRQGTLTHVERDKRKVYQAFLFNDILLCTTLQGKLSRIGFTLTNSIDLQRCNLKFHYETVIRLDLCQSHFVGDTFRLSSPRRTFTFQASSEAECRVWIDSIVSSTSYRIATHVPLEPFRVKKMKKLSDSWIRQRRHVIRELNETENHYVSQLKIMLDTQHWKPYMSTKLSSDMHNRLFGDIDVMIEAHSAFRNQLASAIQMAKDDIYVGNLFLEIVPQLRDLYSQQITYGFSYSHILSETMKKYGQLGDYLILPFQRITRYSLLLSRLVEATPLDHEDRAILIGALEEVRSFLHELNDKRREYDQTIEMQLSSTQIYGYNEEILVAGRLLIQQRDVEQVNLDDTLSSCRLFIYDDIILLTKKKSSTNFQFIQAFPCNSSRLHIAGADFPRRFVLKSPESSAVLQCRTPLEYINTLNCIEKHLDQSYWYHPRDKRMEKGLETRRKELTFRTTESYVMIKTFAGWAPRWLKLRGSVLYVCTLPELSIEQSCVMDGCRIGICEDEQRHNVFRIISPHNEEVLRASPPTYTQMIEWIQCLRGVTVSTEKAPKKALSRRVPSFFKKNPSPTGGRSVLSQSMK